MSGIFGILDTSGSGLSAQRKKLNAVAENIANVETTRTPEGGPYRRKQVVFGNDSAGGFRYDLDRAMLNINRTDVRHLSNADGMNGSYEQANSLEAEEMEIEPDSFKMVYDPTHPDADKDGYVAMPDINIISEMVDMMAATRAYEANISVSSAAKSMFKEALDI